MWSYITQLQKYLQFFFLFISISNITYCDLQQLLLCYLSLIYIYIYGEFMEGLEGKEERSSAYVVLAILKQFPEADVGLGIF